MFSDGNKRTAQLAANSALIAYGCGILVVPIEEKSRFGELLIKYYETNDSDELKAFLYDFCLSGADINGKPLHAPASAEHESGVDH